MRKRHKPSLKEGIVLPDQPFATSLGFTSDKFDGYLWKDGNDIWVPVITSKNPSHGNLTRLFLAIQSAGYHIYVPTPFGKMRAILAHLGFFKQNMPWENSEHPVEVQSPHHKGWTWQHHKMGVVLKNSIPNNEMVEVWVSST